jgi:hypothetical protein
MVSRRYGSGSLTTDFGWRVRGTDIWRGLLVWFLGAIATVVANLPWLHDNTAERMQRALRHGYHHLGPLAIFEFALVAIVAAPLLEELAFRELNRSGDTGGVARVRAALALRPRCDVGASGSSTRLRSERAQQRQVR